MTVKNRFNIIEPSLGEGIFLQKDVSQILQLPNKKVQRWLKDFWDGRFACDYTYSFGDEKNKAVNFFTLIEFFTFYHLRKSGLSAQKIQKYHTLLSKELNTIYPFARTIHTDGKSIWYESLDELIKADGKRQIDFKAILEPFLDKIEFGKNGLATRYFPVPNSKKIVVDPKHQFGQPTIFGRNIKTSTIYNLYKGGEPNENICKLYDLSMKEVKDALLFHNPAA